MLGITADPLVSSDIIGDSRASIVDAEMTRVIAGMVLALTRGKSVFDAARFGVATGAAAVKAEGTELCRREDAERLYEEMES